MVSRGIRTGGRGARSRLETSKRSGAIKKVPYGSTYRTLAQEGNIKIIVGNKGIGNFNKTPMESQTKNRIYGYVNTSGKLSSIVFMNERGKRMKQIDWGHNHKKESDFHIHIGIDHKKTNARYKLSAKEKRVYNEVIELARRNGIGIHTG